MHDGRERPSNVDVLYDLLEQHVGEGAWQQTSRARYVRHTVDVIGLPRRSRLDHVSIDAIDQHPRRLADALLVTLGRDQPLRLVEPLEALALDRVRNVIDEISGARAFLGRVSERAD